MVGTDYAVDLAEVAVLPLVGVTLVIGAAAEGDEVVELDGDDGGVLPVALPEVGGGVAGKIEADEVGVEALAEGDNGGEFILCRYPFLCIYVRAKLHDELPLAVGELLRACGEGQAKAKQQEGDEKSVHVSKGLAR